MHLVLTLHAGTSGKFYFIFCILDNHYAVMYSERDDVKGRVVVYCGFTKLWLNWNSAGTGRYVSNATCWLTGVEF